MSDLTTFSSEQVNAVANRVIEKVANRYRCDSRPKAALLAGQPGAGKTVLSERLKEQFQYNAILINGDDYRRFHPNYRELHERFGADAVSMTSAFSGAVTELLIDELSNQGYNLIIEGTGRTVDVPRKTAELLESKDYDVHIAVIATRPEISLLSTLLRFYQMSESGTLPRATAVDAHDKIVAVLPDNLDKLNNLPCISHLSIHSRELKEIYNGIAPTLRPSSVLRGFWSIPWTEQEIQDARTTLDLLRKKEAQLRLGQTSVIDEAERRLNDAISGKTSPIEAAARKMVEDAAAAQLWDNEQEI